MLAICLHASAMELSTMASSPSMRPAISSFSSHVVSVLPSVARGGGGASDDDTAAGARTWVRLKVLVTLLREEMVPARVGTARATDAVRAAMAGGRKP